ncbi:TSUP family transporter [Planctomicrobium sp. SH664]|uniref:TSUP family transporter n=1 Tax=Planctomicrobium sp. SH664 TaxID=3448125 RepID=UPI003F5B298C
MSTVKLVLFVLLGILATLFSGVWLLNSRPRERHNVPTAWQMLVGFITDFLDTLGIGSFAVTATLYRLRKTVADERIPGTMNVGHALPTVAQAFIYITLIEVDARTLLVTIVSAVLGAWLGAGVVIQWPRVWIQRGMGLALLAAAGLLAARLIGFLPAGGTAIALDGLPLVVAVIGTALFGALMMIGVGAYAPIMIMVCLLGMNPKSAFPIMMGACAFLMPTSGIRIVRAGTFDSRAAWGLTIGGIPGVLLAAYIVKELPLELMSWLVLAIVITTAVTILIASTRAEQTPATVTTGPATRVEGDVQTAAQ